MSETSLEKLVNSFRINDSLELMNDTLGMPGRESNYESTKDAIGVNLKQCFDDVLSHHRSIDLLYKSGNTIVGEVSFDGLIYSVNRPAQLEYIHCFDDYPNEFKQLTSTLYPVDILRQSRDSVTVAAIKVISELRLEFWIWNNAGHKYRLKFDTFNDYIKSGINCNFCIGWQYFYIDTEAFDFNDSFTHEWLAPNFNQGIARMESCLELMLKYFPQDDWSYHKAELDRVKGLLN